MQPGRRTSERAQRWNGTSIGKRDGRAPGRLGLVGAACHGYDLLSYCDMSDNRAWRWRVLPSGAGEAWGGNVISSACLLATLLTAVATMTACGPGGSPAPFT